MGRIYSMLSVLHSRLPDFFGIVSHAGVFFFSVFVLIVLVKTNPQKNSLMTIPIRTLPQTSTAKASFATF